MKEPAMKGTLKNKMKVISTKWVSYLAMALSTFIIISCNVKPKQQNEPAASDNATAEFSQTEEWISLFDGKTLNGWRGFSMDKAPDGWVVEDGTIKILPKTDWPRQADGQPILGADLITVETFDNFELVWEWKIGPKGNSGIKYNVSEEMSVAYPPKGCALGFEYQMMDASGSSGQAPKDNTTGGLYDLVPPAKDKIEKPVGEWNTSRIILNGNHGEHWLNGKKVLEYDLGSDQFNSFVAGSKFKDIPGFADKRKGHIVLQDHAEEAWFRNIKIREL